MAGLLIDGRTCARHLKDDLAPEISRSLTAGHRVGLATVIVGDSFSATAYEQRLRRIATELKVAYLPQRLPASTTQDELIAVIGKLNTSPKVSGILILRPLPAHIDEAEVFQAITPLKDIEAVNPENAGLLALGAPRFVPSAAASAFHLLDTCLDTLGESRSDFYHRSLIVVVGRSNNVGKPAISLGYNREAAVESVDEWADKAGALGRHTRRADVLIVAAGKVGLIKAEHVSPHAIVVDVGINAQTTIDGSVRLVGDVDFESVSPRVRAITPVPGGVGPVTDAWLLRNTVLAAQLIAGQRANETPLSPLHAEQPALAAS